MTQETTRPATSTRPTQSRSTTTAARRSKVPSAWPRSPFDYDYDNNVQRGAASAGTDAPVTVVAIGEGVAEWTIGQFTISRQTGLSFPVNANDELVYSNPV